MNNSSFKPISAAVPQLFHEVPYRNLYYETSTCFQKPVLHVHQTTAKISFTTLDPVVRIDLEIRFSKSKTPFQSNLFERRTILFKGGDS